MEQTGIAENLKQVKATLPASVTLIAVSKTKPNQLLKEAYDAGQRDFGENYVQEMVDKATSLPTDIRWHFIGHLQTNKVKYIIPFVHLIHGVDSFKLLEEINKQAAKKGRVINCLIQIYIAREESKFGFTAEECLLMTMTDKFKKLKNVKICGVMGMASNTRSISLLHSEFTHLKDCFDALNRSIPSCLEISAGMSSDFEIALKHGSTMVRIGSSIFGERN